MIDNNQDEKAVHDIASLEEKFIPILNEAIEQMRNPDDSISSHAQIAIETVLLKTAGFMEGCFIFNGLLLTGVRNKRLPTDVVLGLYDMGFHAAEEEFPKHEAEIHELIKQRMIAAQTKVIDHG